MNYGIKLGAKAPLEWTDRHERVFVAIDALWDDLRSLWIQCRQEQELMEEATGDADLLSARAVVSRAQQAVDGAFDARRDWRRANRRKDAPREIESAIDSACRERRQARKRAVEEARRVRREIRDDLVALWNERDRRMRSIAQGRTRRYKELHDGVYNDLLKRFFTAAREAAKVGRIPRPAAEHPSRSIYRQVKARTVGGTRIEREGKRARIEGGELVGTTWEDLLSSRSSVRIEPYDLGARVTRRWGLLCMPADSERTPLRIPVRLDQSPPADALVKGIRAVRRSGSEGDQWHVVISIEGEPIRPVAAGDETLYLGLNWRRVDGGLRVLDGVEESGTRVQLVLPDEHLAQVGYADLLQSALDKRAIEAAAQAKLDHPDRADEIDGVVRRRDWRELDGIASSTWTRGTHTGRETHAGLLVARRAARGDPEKQAILAADVLGDKAGRRQVGSLRSKCIRRREDLYRRAARWIAEGYERVVVADADGSRLARRESADSSDVSPLPLQARRYRQAAAPFALASALRWAMMRSGGDLVETPAIDLSHTCPICREEMHRSESDRAALHLRCSVHGLWDRDHALALALWRDAAGDDRERCLWHADEAQRSQAQIVRIDAELEARLRGHGEAYRRLRYVTGQRLRSRRNRVG